MTEPTESDNRPYHNIIEPEEDIMGAQQADGLSQAEPEEVSALRASIPSADRPKLPLWLDQRRRQMRWEVYNGTVILDYPNVLKPEEIDELETVLGLCLKSLRRTAQARVAESDAP